MEHQLLENIILLKSLNAQTLPLWGKMSPQHMVEHLILAVQMSNGKLRVENKADVSKLPTLKRFLLSSRPLPKEFVNPLIGKNLLPLIFSSMVEAVQHLTIEVKDYLSYFSSNPDAVLINATFGPLNFSEWEIFHQKHFRHHFAQFGLDFSINNKAQ